MAENTKIEWCDATINFWIGCTKVSAACDHCYAEAMAARFGLATWGHGEPRVRTKSAVATAFRLDRKAAKLGRRLKVFSNSMSDFFDAEVPDEWRDEAMAVMALTPNLDWLVLTKRPKVMRAYVDGMWARREALGDLMGTIGGPDRAGWYAPECDGKRGWVNMHLPLPNVWLGVTAEDQAMADLRIPDLLATPAARRFVSVEPMLGAVDLGAWLPGCYECAEECGWRSGSAPDEEVCHYCGWLGSAEGEFCSRCGHQDFGHVCPRCEANAVHHHPDTPVLDWIICGGESGPHARPTHPDWARSLRDQCQAAGVPFFFKQWGAWTPIGTRDDLPGKPQMVRAGDGFITPDGDWHEVEVDLSSRLEADGTPMRRIGKARAGRLLDGREWNEVPA